MSCVRFGAGFRTPHFDAIACAPRALDWLELVSENFIDIGGARRAMLDRLRADHPIALHGVSLSIAGSDPLDADYLRGLRELCDRVEPVFVGDHLSWTALDGRQSHDLLPVAWTERVLDHVAARVAAVQEILGRRLTLENASAYVALRGAEMSEAEFGAELSRRTGCGLLVDVNNLYVNARNLGVDPLRHLAELPPEHVDYMHLAGHAVLADVRIDTHDADVPDPVWELFDTAVRRFPAAGVIVERDDNLPPFSELCAEVERARARHARALERTESAVVAKSTRAVGVVSSSVGAPADWRERQTAFFREVVDGAPSTPESLVDGDLPVTASRGLRVYRDAYATSLPRALATNFPALARVVSPEDWSALCAAYLRAHPPRGHDFRSLGAGLAAFVREFPFRAHYGIDARVLAELVALDQAQLEVQDEIDELAPITPEALAALTPAQWESARFKFVRALRIVNATHDVLPAVVAVARGETPARPKADPTDFLISRSDDRLHSERIPARDASLLASFIDGRNLAEACAAEHVRAGGEFEAIALDAVRVLVDATRRGLVLRVD